VDATRAAVCNAISSSSSRAAYVLRSWSEEGEVNKPFVKRRRLRTAGRIYDDNNSSNNQGRTRHLLYIVLKEGRRPMPKTYGNGSYARLARIQLELSQMHMAYKSRERSVSKEASGVRIEERRYRWGCR
jgi:hypothetical protein